MSTSALAAAGQGFAAANEVDRTPPVIVAQLTGQALCPEPTSKFDSLSEPYLWLPPWGTGRQR